MTCINCTYLHKIDNILKSFLEFMKFKTCIFKIKINISDCDMFFGTSTLTQFENTCKKKNYKVCMFIEYGRYGEHEPYIFKN